MKGQSNETRQHLTRSRFQVKVDLLEQYKVDGVPPHYKVPRSMNEFRAWVDEENGIFSIRSPSTTNARISPEHGDLINRASELIAWFKRQEGKPRKAVPPVKVLLDRTQHSLRVEQELNARLTSQLHSLMHRVDVAEKRARAAQKSLELQRQTEEELRERIAALTGPGLRVVK